MMNDYYYAVDGTLEGKLVMEGMSVTDGVELGKNVVEGT